ncbi:MAG: recombination regulator RecX [Bacteroidales bacterium]|jgi:regulatory protein|nr:recombination regulator RecX [Bacteroidales bacterium]
MNKRILPPQKAFEKLMAYCSKMERSEFDVRQKLFNWGIDTKKADEIIEQLKKDSFLDSSRYIQAFIRGKYYYNKWGRVKIRFNLKLKGFSDDEINSAMDAFFSTVDYEAMICEQLTRKNKSLTIDDEYQRKSKLILFGQSRGYETEISLNCVDKIIN